MSKKHLLCAFMLFSGCAVAAASQPPAELRDLFDRQRVPEDHIGLYIAPVDQNDNAISLNATKSFNPASVIKLLPSLAALEMFSPAYQWATDVFITGEVTNGNLTGDLFISGGGDPYLTVESMWALLKSVRARGIERIQGDIVVDDGVYKLPVFDRAAFDGKPHRIYNGPASALMMNFWAVRFTVTAMTDRVNVNAFPDSESLEIINGIKHSTSPCAGKNRRVGYSVEEKENSIVVAFSGTLSTQCAPIVMDRAVIPAERYVAYVLPGMWRDAGGSLDGKVRRGTVPEKVRRIYTHASRSMAEVVRATNKYSNNMMARHLLLSLGTLYKERDVEVEDGVVALQDWLLARGIDTPGLYIDNGSGLSRDTRISALGLGNLLRAGFHSRNAPEFLASFPVAGEDWALKSRDFGGQEKDVRIKTGLIDHVRSMAGYVKSESGKTYIVVLLVNHSGIHQGVGTRLQNALIRYVLDL